MASHNDDPIIELLNTEQTPTSHDIDDDNNNITSNDNGDLPTIERSDFNLHDNVSDTLKHDTFDLPTPLNNNHTFVNTPTLPQHQLYEVFDDVINPSIPTGSPNLVNDSNEFKSNNNATTTTTNNNNNNNNDNSNNNNDEIISNGSTGYDNNLLGPINDFISHPNNQLMLSSANKGYLTSLPPMSPLSESVIPNGISVHPITIPLMDDNKKRALVSQKNQVSTNNTSNSTTASASKKRKKDSTHKSRTLFVNKLWSMVNDPSNDNYIRWNDSGKTFQVFHLEEFVKNVLPKYFKHNNFASFVRQLNMYGWHKVQDINSGTLSSGSNGSDSKSGDDEILQFENPNFIRGREDLLDKIVRNKTSTNQDEENISNNTNASNQVNFQIIINELDNIKMNQLAIGEDLRRVRKDNKTLWNENFMARERHSQQAQTLEKILKFLSVVYGNNNGGKILEVDDVPFNNLGSNEGNSFSDNLYGQSGTTNATGPTFNKPRLMLTDQAHRKSSGSVNSPSTGSSRPSVAESSTGSIEEIIRSYGTTPKQSARNPTTTNTSNGPSNESIDAANRIYQQIINQEPVPVNTTNTNKPNHIVSSPRHFFPELNTSGNSPSPYLGASSGNPGNFNPNNYVRINEPVPNSTDIMTGLEQNLYKQGQSIQQVQDWIQKLAQQQQQLQEQHDQKHDNFEEEEEDGDLEGMDGFDVNEFLNSGNSSSNGNIVENGSRPEPVVITPGSDDLSGNSKRSIEEIYDGKDAELDTSTTSRTRNRKVRKR